jgi:LPS export ABC transporter protein LptC
MSGRALARLGWLGVAGALMAPGACADTGVVPGQSAIAVDSADQVLEQMVTAIVGDGVRKSLVSADTAFIYSDRQVARLLKLRATFFNEDGSPSTVLTAKRGEYLMARGTLEAWDSVVVVATDGSNRRLRSQHLIYDRDRNQIRSDSSFVYDSPTGTLTGSRFISDPSFKNFTTDQPKGRQKGQGMALPGQ